MVKRGGESPPRHGRPGKRSRTVNLVAVDVDTLGASEALPLDLRTLFKESLPAILEKNKADRYPNEHEIVAKAEKALAIVAAAIEKEHAGALQKQNEVTSPEEHARRRQAKRDAEAALEAGVKKLEASKEAQANCKKAMQEAQSQLKALQKESTGAEKEMQAIANKKTNLTDLLANEFIVLQSETSSTPAGKSAVKKLLAVGKEYGLDDTFLVMIPLTCKKDPAARLKFETMMFTTLKVAIDGQIDGLTQRTAELEPKKAEKLAAVTAAEQNVEKAQAALSAANEEHSSTQAAQKDADKAVGKADDYLYKIWGHMKEACDAQDDLADKITNFKETEQSFHQLRDREPEPEPVEEPEPAAASPDAEAEASPEASAEASPQPAADPETPAGAKSRDARKEAKREEKKASKKQGKK